MATDQQLTADQVIIETLRQLNDRIEGSKKRLLKIEEDRVKEEAERVEIEAALVALAAGTKVDLVQFRTDEAAAKAAAAGAIG